MPQANRKPWSLGQVASLLAAVVVGAAVSVPIVRAGDQPTPKTEGKAPQAQFPREWFWAEDDKAWQAIKRIQGSPAKALSTKDWRGEPQDLDALKGKIILIDFWATWCPPCRALIPAVNDLAAKYKEKGLVVFGVCNTEGANNMAAVAEKHGMKYPTGADVAKRTESAYGVRWWPFFVLIDREGVVRAAGLHPDHLSDAVDALLREQPAK